MAGHYSGSKVILCAIQSQCSQRWRPKPEFSTPVLGYSCIAVIMFVHPVYCLKDSFCQSSHLEQSFCLPLPVRKRSCLLIFHVSSTTSSCGYFNQTLAIQHRYRLKPDHFEKLDTRVFTTFVQLVSVFDLRTGQLVWTSLTLPVGRCTTPACLDFVFACRIWKKNLMSIMSNHLRLACDSCTTLITLNVSPLVSLSFKDLNIL